MAKAYSCDRCGGLFKQSDYEPDILIVLESDREFNMDFSNAREFLSLCPTCRKSFQKWWDLDAVNKTTDDMHQCNIYEVPEENDDE